MKLMNDSIFVDSNILIYTYSSNDIHKQTIARSIIQNNNTIISTQVLQELTNVLTRKLNVSYSFIPDVISECCQNNQIHYNTENTIIHACSIAGKYKFSFYDSMIIAAAIENSCSILYSEDMQHNQSIGMLKIINPFL